MDGNDILWDSFAQMSAFFFCISKSLAETVSPEVSNPEAEPENQPETESENHANAPEAESGDMIQTWVFVTLYSVIIFIILVGNIIVALTIICDRHLHANVSNLYLFSLVTSRASIAVFVIPARITGMFSEKYLGGILCRLCHFSALGSHSTSIFSITAIAITKYHEVTYGDRTKLTLRQSILAIVLIWVIGFLYAIRAAVTNDLVSVNIVTGSIWSCTIAPMYENLTKYFILVDFACLFAMPFIIIIFCYSRVILKLSTISVEEKDGDMAISVRDKQSTRAVKMLVILTTLFAVCTMAPMILNLYILWGGDRFESFPIVEAFVYMFSYSNSWFNLIVFAYFRDDLQRAFMSMIRQRCYFSSSNSVTPIMESKQSMEEMNQSRQNALHMMEI